MNSICKCTCTRCEDVRDGLFGCQHCGSPLCVIGSTLNTDRLNAWKEKTLVVIRLPETTMDRKRAYMKAAGAAKQSLADWIFEQCDKAAGKRIMRTKHEDDAVMVRLLDQQAQEIESLRAQNAELLEALKESRKEMAHFDKGPIQLFQHVIEKADSAIRRAEEKK